MEYPTLDSYTTLLTQDFHEFPNPSQSELGNEQLDESPPLSAMNTQPTNKGRSKNFSEEEDNMLVSAWLNVSRDPIQGNHQKGDTFWMRVDKYFHENKQFDSDRNPTSLKKRWQLLQKEVNEFQGCYDKIDRNQQSGKTLTNKIADAKNMFKQVTKKSFSFFHAWNTLKHQPKWTDSRPAKKPRLSSTNTPSPSTPEIPDVLHAENTNEINVQRPMGRKAEKECLRRGRNKGHDGVDPFIDEVRKLREVRENSEKDRKERDDRYYAQEQERLAVEKERLQLEKFQEERKIMEKDTTGMDGVTKTYFNKLKEDIVARQFGKE